MNARILAVGAVVAVILAVIAVLMAAWIMGDAQPTRWIETPVAVAASGPGAKGSGAGQ